MAVLTGSCCHLRSTHGWSGWSGVVLDGFFAGVLAAWLMMASLQITFCGAGLGMGLLGWIGLLGWHSCVWGFHSCWCENGCRLSSNILVSSLVCLYVLGRSHEDG